MGPHISLYFHKQMQIINNEFLCTKISGINLQLHNIHKQKKQNDFHSEGSVTSSATPRNDLTRDLMQVGKFNGQNFTLLKF